jgi:hypothetical protein
MDKRNELALCACSGDSYNVFSELYDNIIVDNPYQKELTSGGFQNIEFTAEDSVRIKKI